MKVKFSGMGVVEGRGKINGTVASKNRSGAYLRVKVSGVNPQTTYQQAARNQLTTLSQGWRALTQPARDAWNSAVSNFARTDIFGDLRNPTGKNLYTRLNANILNVGGTAIDSPPLPDGAGPAVIGAIVMTEGGAKTVAHNVTAAAFPLQVWATPPVSPGKSFLKGDYRLIQTLAGAATSPSDISTAYEARFGEPTADQKVGVMLVPININTGESGTGSAGTTIVV